MPCLETTLCNEGMGYGEQDTHLDLPVFVITIELYLHIVLFIYSPLIMAP